MIRSAFLLCAALLAAVTFACQAPPPPFASPPPTPRAGAFYTYNPQILTCNPDPFVNKAYTISSDPAIFDPTNNSTYAPPAGIKQIADPSNKLDLFKKDLGDAYCLASPRIQAMLADLTAIFITCADPTNCAPSGQNAFSTSWGYRENANNQSVLQHTYIALSADLWPSSGTAWVYSELEKAIFDNLMAPPTGDPRPLDIVASPDTRPMAILAALAHELGHIYWWKMAVNTFNCGGLFADYSWVPAPDHTPQFHGFGQENSGKSRRNTTGKGHVYSDIHTQNGQIYKDLRKIYNGEWASVFATVAPDEDFVETFKLSVLMSAGLSSLQISIPSGGSFSVDMVGYMNNAGNASPPPKLNQKNRWIQSCFMWP